MQRRSPQKLQQATKALNEYLQSARATVRWVTTPLRKLGTGLKRMMRELPEDAAKRMPHGVSPYKGDMYYVNMQHN